MVGFLIGGERRNSRKNLFFIDRWGREKKSSSDDDDFLIIVWRGGGGVGGGKRSTMNNIKHNEILYRVSEMQF